MSIPTAGAGLKVPLVPPLLEPGDRVRFVSPGSTPDRERLMRSAAVLEAWGLSVEIGRHAFDRLSFLAGPDEARLADLNEALRDPSIRAVLATRGGKGSYRIADGIDFAAVRRDPKFIVGFSDVTALHLALSRACGLVSIHGAVVDGPSDAAMRRCLMEGGETILEARADEPTAALSTAGRDAGSRARGRLIGGNLDTIAACAGWALPPLAGAILLIEAVEMQMGQVDRQLTMLAKAGHLEGVAGIAVGQFTGFQPSSGGLTIVDLLRDHLGRLGVPVLGGLPVGHGPGWLPLPLGAMAELDVTAATLRIRSVWPQPGG